MSGESHATDGSTQQGAESLEPPGLGRRHTGVTRPRVAIGASLVALVAIGASTAVRMARNLPFHPVTVPPAVDHLAFGSVPAVALGLALVTIGLLSARSAVRVGLLFAGVFGLLAILTPAATLPAVVAIPAGIALATLGVLGRPQTPAAGLKSLAVIASVAGMTVSLASTTGLLDGGVRGLGALLVLGAAVIVGLVASNERIGLLTGGLTVLVIVVAAVSSPFVFGSAILTGFGVVSVPAVLVAVAAGGLTAATVTGLWQRNWWLAVGGGMLLSAGIPATVPRALAVGLGVTFAVVQSGVLDNHGGTRPEGAS